MADETDHRVKRIVEAERNIDERLCQAFISFQDPASLAQKGKAIWDVNTDEKGAK